MNRLKHILLLAPVLLLRKVLLYILVLCIALGLMIYFLANSPLVIKKVADTFAPDYNITYSAIHGNVLTGVKIEDLKFNKAPLANTLRLKWNPSTLVKKKILINKLEISHANVDTIKDLIKVFSSPKVNDNNVSKETDKPFSLSIEVEHIALSLDPFVEQNISLSSVALDVQSLFYGDEKVKVENVNINVLDINTLPQNVDPLVLRYLNVHVEKVLFEIPTLMLEKANLEVNASSNLANVYCRTTVKNNILKGEVKLNLDETLFTRYDLPVRKAAIGPLLIHLDASEKLIVADLDTQMKQLLKTDSNSSFNLDVEQLKSHVEFSVKDSHITAHSSLLLNTPYANNITVSNDFTLADTMMYSGEVHSPHLIGIDKKFTKPMDNLLIEYHGDATSVTTQIRSDALKGSFVSKDFKTALFHLESKEEMLINQFVTLPTELNQTKAKIEIDVPFAFESNSSIVGHAKVRSNVVNLDANVSYTKKIQLKAKIDIPEKSLLKAYDEKLKWKQITPIFLKASLDGEDAKGTLKTKSIQADVLYDLNSTTIGGNIRLGGLKASITGTTKEKMTIGLNIDSVPSLVKNIALIYPLKGIPKLEGKVKLSANIKQLKDISLSLKSPRFAYISDSKSKEVIKNVDISLDMNVSEVVLKQYHFVYDKEKFFATKPSKVTMHDTQIHIEELWLNDALKVQGKYDLKRKKGEIVALAKRLPIAHEIIDLHAGIDLKTFLDGNATTINGKIILLDGNIHYDLSQKSFASDSDIIIVQDIKEKKESPFMDNLSADIQLKTKQPLVYKQGAINIKTSVDLGIHKAKHSELMVLGTVTLLKGGTYTFEGKRFVLDDSYVHFTGDVNKPLLEMTVNYQALNHLVTIRITGGADMPNIAFSSKPSLSKEQILSLILFDTEGGAGTNSGEDMMKMMGGAMAKSALNNVGIKLDHLVLGEGNSVEVGKKLTDKITIIYVNGEVAEVKLKYKHGKRTESVIGASEVSQSYDIVYKREF